MNQSKTEQALRISMLIKKYLKDKLSQQERQELDQWLMAHPQDRKDLQQLIAQKLNDYDPGTSRVYALEERYAELISRIEEGKHSTTKHSMPWYKFAAAAAIILVVALGLLIYKRQDAATTTLTGSRLQVKKGIELTLANGKIVNLEMQADGVISSENQAIITKKDGQVLSYEAIGKESEISDALNTLSIPRGKKYELILPDGSKVWLNAQSKLSFPSRFSKNERIVELTGEAYFEVNHFSAWPFKVKTQYQQVEVLGTTFNVNAYADEAYSKTALITGSVKVSDEANTLLLKPGQLALKSNNKTGFTISATDIDEATAWKNGKLLFTDEKIEHITQILSRTFDVDFEIDERIRGQHFSGAFTVKNGLNVTLRSLEQTGAIHFKVKGRRISVMP
jgi:transmembrane sensor